MQKTIFLTNCELFAFRGDNSSHWCYNSKKINKNIEMITMKNIYKCTNGIVIIIPEGAEIDLESIATAKQLGNPLDDLTKRQREIIDMVISGFSNKYIAGELSISEGTVKRIIYNAYRVLGITCRGELINLLTTF